MHADLLRFAKKTMAKRTVSSFVAKEKYGLFAETVS
jgi:hypothetical protein